MKVTLERIANIGNGQAAAMPVPPPKLLNAQSFNVVNGTVTVPVAGWADGDAYAMTVGPA